MKTCCQSCGFPVYNRRYPKCESCGVELAEGLAMSVEERRASFEADRIESERAWRERQKRERDAPPSDGGGYVGYYGGGDGGCGGGGGSDC